jgi:prepilin-type N-terminal cleavage/methylation domain-containing protein
MSLRHQSAADTSSWTQRGFTIVELLVVIVVIGILAAITIVSYTGISSKAVNSSLQSDLSGAKKRLAIFYTDNGAYPATNNCGIAESTTNICLKTSGSNSFTYTPINTTSPLAFHLSSTNGSTTYTATDTVGPYTPITCPTGYIVVPGNSTYGTNDFCVMKYEAKNVGGVATSQAASTPWVYITQTSAITTAAAACTGCHLITEGEWLTIAQNVLNVPGNWSGNAVGSGYIYSGHGDNVPANSLAAAADSDPYNGTGQSSPSNQRRTLALSNGEVIWDLAGNVWEWTSGTVQSPAVQPGITGNGGAWREWTAVTNPGTISPNPSASATGIAGASSWNSGNGIGAIWSSADEAGLRGFIRGGFWGFGGAGVLTLNLSCAPSDTYESIGFRVSR